MFPFARVLPSSSLLAICAVVAAGCNVVSVSGSGDDHIPDAAVTAVNPYSPDASDAGVPEASAAAGEAALAAPALPYQGNPLCNASRSTGCCYPDDPPSAQACAQAACQSVPDGGTAGEASGAYVDVALGCHVVPAGPSPDASAGPAITPACLPGGRGFDGFPCSGPADCAPSYECVGATPTCQHYCCDGSDSCGGLQFCDIQPTFPSPQTNVPVCMLMQPCVLLGALSCSANETCAVVRDDGSTSCVTVGGAVAGQSCETEHCARGLACLGAPGARSCYLLCHTAAKPMACSPGQKCQGGLPLFPDPDVGICQ
jgi:hypothetical protein